MSARWTEKEVADFLVRRQQYSLMPEVPLPRDLATLRAELVAARNARDQVQKVYEACQRDVTRLRLALAKAEKEEK